MPALAHATKSGRPHRCAAKGDVASRRRTFENGCDVSSTTEKTLLKLTYCSIAISFSIPCVAIAQTCATLPYPLVNGTTADASQVMADLNCKASLYNPTFSGTSVSVNGASSTGNGVALFLTNTAGTNGWVLGAGGPIGANNFATGDSQAARLVITSLGNLGLGTTAPAAPLHIAGPSTWSTQTPQLKISDIASSMTLNVGVGTDGANKVTWIQSTEAGVSNTRNLSLQPAAGNVGVGTTAPAYTLQVNGQAAGTSAWINFPMAASRSRFNPSRMDWT